MPFNTDTDRAPGNVPLVETSPAVLLANFQFLFEAAPIEPQYVVPGNDVGGAFTSWCLYTRTVLDAWITVMPGIGETSNGQATLIIEIGREFPSLIPAYPETIDWLPIALVGGGVPNVITGLRIPGILCRFRIENGAPNGQSIIEGDMMLRGL